MLPDKKTVEGKPETPAGEAGQSTPPASGEQAQPLPVDVAAILKRLDEQDRRIAGVQKGTDKQIRKQVTGSIDRILELAKDGKTKAQIERELWIDAHMQEPESAEPEPVPDKDGKGDSPDASTVIDQVLPLPANDTRVTDLKLKYAKDKNLDAYYRGRLELFVKLGAQPEATPAEQPPVQGGAASQKVENPIAEITDTRTLYRMAAEQAAKQQKGRRIQ